METVSAGHWMSWCRLCAKSDKNNFNIAERVPVDSSLPNRDIASAIADLLQKQVNNEVKLPQQVCQKCHQELIASLKFRNRAIKVLQMYEFLINCAPKCDLNLKTLFEKFDLLDQVSNLKNQSLETISVSDGPLHLQSTTQNYESIMMEMETNIALSECEKSDNSNTSVGYDEDNKSCSKSKKVLSSSRRCKYKKFKRTEKQNKKIVEGSNNKAQEAKYACYTCSKHFKRRTNFNAHMIKIHGEDTILTKLVPDNSLIDQPKIFICRYCDKKFESKERLAEHFKIDHQDITKQTFVCEICGATYPTKGQLKDHFLIHTDVAPFECKICGIGFKLANRLKRHMEIHQGKHNCNICGKQLSSRTTLNSHLLVHSDSMPHKCDYCGRAFKRAKTLKVHLLAHTGLRPFVCNFCDKSFSTGSSCRAHKKQVHPTELAAMEEEGKKSYTKNLPKLEALKAVVKCGENLKPLRR